MPKDFSGETLVELFHLEPRHAVVLVEEQVEHVDLFMARHPVILERPRLPRTTCSIVVPKSTKVHPSSKSSISEALLREVQRDGLFHLTEEMDTVLFGLRRND